MVDARRVGQLSTSLAVTRGVTEALDRQLLETALLADLARRLLTRTSVDTVAQEVLSVLAGHLETRHAVLAVRRVSTGEATIYFSNSDPAPAPDEPDSLLGLCLTGRASARSNDHPDRALLSAVITLPWIDVPGAAFVGRDFATGRLALGVGLDAARLTAFDTIDRLQAVARFAVSAVDGALLYEEAELRSRTDPLTGLGNRTGYDETSKLSLEHAKRYGTPLSLAVIDLNHFKQINDQLGHEVGDMVLRDVATLLRESLGRGQSCFRLGGDEFIMVLPGTVREEAEATLVAISEKVRTSPLRNFAVSLSAGVASYPADGRIMRQLYTRADKRMYEQKAKARGDLGLRSDI